MIISFGVKLRSFPPKKGHKCSILDVLYSFRGVIGQLRPQLWATALRSNPMNQARKLDKLCECITWFYWYLCPEGYTLLVRPPHSVPSSPYPCTKCPERMMTRDQFSLPRE